MSQPVILSRRTFFLLILCCLWSFFLTLNFVRSVAAKESSGDVYSQLKSFTDVLALVQKNYVEQVKVESLVDGAIKGMLRTLDPHSGYLNKDVFKELQVETKGKFGGLGIEITVKDGLLTVVAPIEDTPAYKAGVQAGDQIIRIDDQFTKDLSLVDAVKKMRGPRGTSVTIYVLREGQKELVPISIKRDVIRVKSVRSRALEDGYGWVRLAQFQEGSARECRKALARMKEKAKDGKIKGIVLDFRNNPGGLLNQAVKVADLFLKDGVIVYTDGRLTNQKQKYFANDDKNEPSYPIVVLVNGGSASASEIVAGALQDHGRALILGLPTFGKGSVQTILPMENGAALRLTTALYYTKSGRSIQAQGITPDVKVSTRRYAVDDGELLEEDEAFPRKEKDLPGALKNPKSSDKSNKDESAKGEKKKERMRIGSRQAMQADLDTLLENDPQLDEALRLLKTWHIFQGKPAA